MNIFVICHSSENRDAFREANPVLSDPVFLENGAGVYDSVNDIIAHEPAPCLIVTDRVYVDDGFPKRIEEAVQQLDACSTSWGVAGAAGMGCNLYGLTANAKINYTANPKFGPNLGGRLLPAQSLAGDILLLNPLALKAKKMVLPNLEDSEFLPLALSMAAIAKGLGAYTLPQLGIYQNGAPEPEKFFASSSFFRLREWLSQIMAQNRLKAYWGDIKLCGCRGNLRLPDDALENSAFNVSKVAIIVRTRFERPEMLWRALSTIQAFICAGGFPDLYDCYVISDREAKDFPDWIKFKYFNPETPLKDSRIFLLCKAVATIDADYFWFIDDDDWLFPNIARFISLSIRSSPPGSTFYVGSQYFKETRLSDQLAWAGSTRATATRYFEPKLFYLSISGCNFIPFCGIIFPAKTARNLLSNNPMGYMTYYEDYCLELLNLYSADFFPVVLEGLVVGISIRDYGNTVTSFTDPRWYKSACAMFYEVINNSNPLISLSANVMRSCYPTRDDMLANVKYAELKFIFKCKVRNKIKYIKDRIGKKFFKYIPPRFYKFK